VTKKARSSVLCIGNDPVSLNLRSSLLKEHGWNVFTAGSGHDGIQRFTHQVVDAVVVDLNNGGAEAAIITGELKRLKPGIPVVMLVPDEKATETEATRLADAVVVKPQEGHKLVGALKAVLHKQ